MSGELDEKGLEAAHVAYERYGQAGDLKTQRLSSGCIAAIVRAYLAASPSPSEMDVVATSWVYMGRVRYAPDAAFSPSDIDRGIVSEVTPLVTLSSAQSALAAMRAERDEAIDRSKVWEYNWSQEVKVKAEVVGWCKNYQARIKALEEALRAVSDTSHRTNDRLHYQFPLAIMVKVDAVLNQKEQADG